MSPGPFREAAEMYRRAGWEGVLPLPAGQKGPPPAGWTGRGAPYPSGADVAAWLDDPATAAGNIGLRMPDGVLGLDVDDYGEKAGATWLDGLVERLGPLPETWMSTAREGRSGIRFFAVPTGLRWPGQAAPGIDIIQQVHRYAVVWPSIHPNGQMYQWSWPEGLAGSQVPHASSPRPLPQAWVDYLGGLVSGSEVAKSDDLGIEAAWQWGRGLRDGQPCDVVRRVLDEAVGTLEAGARGSRHLIMTDASRALAAYGGEGHAGAGPALGRLRDAFLAAVAGERDGGPEWDRAITGAVRLAAAANPEPRQECDCAAWSGEGLLFDPGQDGGGPGKAEGYVFDGNLANALEARLLSTAQIRLIPPPEQLVKGLLTLDSEAWLIAQSGAGKTFVALDLAGHVALGRAWHGREARQGEVFYMVAEGASGMGQRVRAWEQRNGELDNVAWLDMPIQVKDEERWRALVTVCQRRQPKLIILDTQARITVGLNENDNSEMGQFVEAIGRLRRATRACVLVVHHLGRQGQYARGASAIDGAQDTELRLTRTSDTRLVLETDKQRHLPGDVRVEMELLPVALDGGGGSLVIGPPLIGVRGDPDFRANLPLNQTVLVDVMGDIFPQRGATKAELKAEVKKRVRRDADGKVLEPMEDSSFRRAWDALTASERFTRMHGTERYRLIEFSSATAEEII